jgi:DNA topoisomerase-1
MKIVKLKKSLETEEIKFKNKEDNKAVALGTSKINYMDPRITIAWCKKREV